MSKITTEAVEVAGEIAEALTSSGYIADFNPASLREIDRFFIDHSADGKPTPGGLLSSDLGQRIFAIGCYVGEVIRRASGGTWCGNDADPRVEINIEVVLPDGTRCWPVQRVMKRFRNGEEDSIEVYGAALGLAVRAP